MKNFVRKASGLLMLSLALCAPGARAQAGPATPEQVNDLVKQLLIGENSSGYDPKYKGILINWLRSNLTQVNCGGADVCDTQPNSTRHDSINDVRDLQHLYWYSYRNPADTSFNAAIQNVVATTKSEWGTTSLDKGWVYGILLRLYEYAPTAAERAYWQNVIVKYWAPVNFKNLDPTLHVQINYNVGNCDCGSSTIYLAQSFRIPYALEIGADLIDAGTRFGHPEWVTGGYQSVQSVASLALVQKYGLTGRIFLISDPKYSGTNYVWDTESQPQDTSEMAEALVRAASIVSVSASGVNGPAMSDYMNALAAQMMDGLSTAGQLHDKTYGGFFESFFVGTNFDGSAAGTTKTSYKEGRQLSLLGTAHLYDLFNNSTHFAALETEMLRLNSQPNTPAVAGVNGMLLPDTTVGTPGVVNGYNTNTLGYTFEVNGNFGLYRSSGVYQDWVSAEQDNLALLGMQEWLSTATPTAATVTASSLNTVVGAGETLTASVLGSNTTAATGTVLFYDGTVLLGSGVLDSSGKAQFSTTQLTAGTHSISVKFAGDTDFYAASSSSSLSITVGGNVTSTALTGSPNPVLQGKPITFTSTVSSNSTGTPSGTVTFLDNGITLGTGTLAARVTTFNTSALAVGPHSITAVYGGDATFAASSSTPLAVTVTGVPTDTATSLTATPGTAAAGSSVTFNTDVSNSSSGYQQATGTVTFSDAGSALGTAPLTSGSTSFIATNLGVGSHAVTAAYSGDATHNASTSLPVTVNITAIPVNTATTLSASASTVPEGSTVTFTARSSATANGVPTGVVDFFDGNMNIASRTLDASGSATVSTSALSAGSHTISAAYEGDATHNSSISASIPVNVTAVAAVSSLSLTPELASLSYGTQESLTLQVSSAANGVPSGNVTLLDSGVALATLALDSSGTASYASSTLPVGTHSFSASYTGDAGHNPAMSAPATVQVTALSTTTTLSASSGNLATGAQLTLTATVGSANGFAASGAVSFLDGSAPLGSSTLTAGVATFSTSTLTVGVHSLQAVYAGDATHSGSSSTSLPVTVGAPAFTLTASPTSVTATAATAATVALSVSALFGFNQAIALSVTGLPPHASARFAATTLTPGSNGNAATNLFIAINGQTADARPPHPGREREAIFFALLVGGSLFSARRKRALLVRLLGLGVVLALGAATGCGSSSTAIATSSAPLTPAGTYVLTVTATGTTQTQTAAVNLVVQ